MICHDKNCCDLWLKNFRGAAEDILHKASNSKQPQKHCRSRCFLNVWKYFTYLDYLKFGEKKSEAQILIKIEIIQSKENYSNKEEENKNLRTQYCSHFDNSRFENSNGSFDSCFCCFRGILSIEVLKYPSKQEF